jgi:anti-sigma regulatory factor (Ser/Thr protein kinase)
MRRNAESLLVLAGIDPPRKWAAPVRITDAIRAALGEVEDYQRVTVRQVEPTTVMGSAAADLAHLLAELIENALIFSPPDQTVEIRGRAQPAGYTLAIIDSGLGMPPEELARANRRLAGAESFTIAPSKYLGHYVAGNLAARHTINVTLHNSPGHGITATINLPPTLLTTEPTGTTAAGGPTDTAPGAPQLSSEFTPGPDRSPKPRRPEGLPTPHPAPVPAPLLATEQTSGGLTERATQQPAIPTSGRTQPAVPSDDLLETLANYTTQLHQQLSSPQGAAPTVGAPERDHDRPRDDAPPLPGRAADPYGGNGRPPAGPGPGPEADVPGRRGDNGAGPGRIPTSGRSGIVDNGGGPDPLAGLAAWSRDSSGLPPTQPTEAVSPSGFGGPPAGPGPGGPGSGGPGPGGPGPGLGGPGGPGPGGPLPRRGPDQPGPADYADRRGPADRGPGGPGEPPPRLPGQPPAGRGRPPALPGRPHFGDPTEQRQPLGRHPDQPGDGSRPPLGPPPGGLGGLGGPPPGAPAGPGGAPDPGTGGATQGGLARRVRGAQMPATEPLSLRRGTGGGQRQGPGGPSSTPFAASPPSSGDRSRSGRSSAPEVPASNGDHRAADEVYGFLSSFTAGVQRGLDESRPGDEDDDDR